jgi:hypothetical protein
MKHIRKFNESIENKDEMIEYIKLCFIDFYDELGKNGISTEEFDDRFEMLIDEPELKSEKSISDFVKYGEELAEFYKEIENCLEKVAIKYDIKTKFEYQFPPEGHIIIIFVFSGKKKKKSKKPL